MRIPRRVNERAFKLFIFQIARKVGVELRDIEFDPGLKSGGQAFCSEGRIVLRIPHRKKYSPKAYLYITAHEIAHLLNPKSGHEGLCSVTQRIYKICGWSMGQIADFEESYDRMMTEKESLPI